MIRRCIISRTLTRPATPAVASVWPILPFIDPKNGTDVVLNSRLFECFSGSRLGEVITLEELGRGRFFEVSGFGAVGPLVAREFTLSSTFAVTPFKRLKKSEDFCSLNGVVVGLGASPVRIERKRALAPVLGGLSTGVACEELAELEGDRA